ncbi:MAG: head GIN domain-containing protein [Bacteroidota bacterium]
MKKNIFLNSVALVLFILVFSACKKENRCDCIKRTGTIIFETREINGFDKIYLEDNLKVYITQGSSFSVKVEGGENIVPLIETIVTEGTLVIRNNNRCNWTRSYDKPLAVHITMPVIKYLTSDGTNDIIGLNTITTPELDVQTKSSGNIELWLDNSKVLSHMHGSGDITLHGKTNEHACDIGGTSFLRCADLQTNLTWVHTFTTGLCYVNTANLTCLIDNIGDVYCYGNPVTIEKVQKGQGQLYIK